MIALAALALAADAPTARLNPVFERPYRLTVAEERSISGRLRHFSQQRRLVFHRDGDGVIAEMTLVAVGQDLGGEAGRRFEAAAGSLRGYPVRVRLTGDGTLRSIDDEAGVWARMTGAMDISTGRRAAEAAALAALPVEARRATIGSIVLPVIAGADATRAPGTRPIVLPSRPVVAGTPLNGQEEVSLEPDARLRIRVHADAAAGERAVSLDRDRRIDAAHGLVVREEETQTIRLGTAAQVTRTIVTLEAPVS